MAWDGSGMTQIPAGTPMAQLCSSHVLQTLSGNLRALLAGSTKISGSWYCTCVAYLSAQATLPDDLLGSKGQQQ